MGAKKQTKSVDPRANGFKKVPLPPDLNRAIPLTDNARTVLRKRYLRRGDDGQPVETEQEMFWRVAFHVAKAEDEFGGDVEANARRFYDLLTNLLFFPNSPTFTGAGTPLGQLAACFVLAIDDDMGRTGWHFRDAAQRGADPADRRRQRLLVQPPASQRRAGQVVERAGDRAGGLSARVR